MIPVKVSTFGRLFVNHPTAHMICKFRTPPKPKPKIAQVQESTRAAISFHGSSQRELHRGSRRANRLPVENSSLAWGSEEYQTDSWTAKNKCHTLWDISILARLRAGAATAA